MSKNSQPANALANASTPEELLEQLAAAHNASVALEQQSQAKARERNQLLLKAIDAGIRPADVARHLGVERQRISVLIHRAKRTE